MQFLQLSSGDLVVDRRASYAEALFSAGDRMAAAELLREALELAPAWAAGWFRCGEMLWEAGRAEEAANCWREVLRLDPADSLGATLRLGLAGAVPLPDHTPPAFVEALFDQYAPDFDSALIETLDYRVPELLAEAIAQTGTSTFAHAVDLGCGTGLMGERLRKSASFLEGVDLSAEMLRRAQAKRIYDRLEKADLLTLAIPEEADLVAAADVFMYVGGLEALFARISASLAPGALFAFSVERHDGDGFMLLASRRYAHSQAYLETLLAENGFEPLSLDRKPIRMDRGEAIEGLIVVARRNDAAAAVVSMGEDQIDPARDRCLPN
ncbi:MAG: methyltransferase domain-containing protein [Rhizobiaceae bacterium]|nr:methyltransferase domain-containing protein [Rhizobiaceae bacterium]